MIPPQIKMLCNITKHVTFIVAVIIIFCTTPSHAQVPRPTPDPGPPSVPFASSVSRCPPTYNPFDCESDYITCTALDTFEETATVRELEFAKDDGPGPADDWEAGDQYVDFWDGLWHGEFQPALSDMIREISTGIVAQSYHFGTLIDAKLQNTVQREIQKMELAARENSTPNENSCAANSQTAALMQTEHIGLAVSSALSQEMADMTLNADGTRTESGPSTDQKISWDLYSSIFCDTLSNNGEPLCPATAPYKDNDVSIEQLLLQDTIELADSDRREGIYALTRNLIYPRTVEPLHPETIPSATHDGTSQGQRALLQRRHLAALRQIPQAVVSGVIGRRAPNPASPTATQIREIRTRAGVSSFEISNRPSYNETMLAMTKERFFNPEYYRNVMNTPGAINQEQTIIDAYTSMQLQDIYELQEQINALAAVKASIKFNKVGLPNAADTAPNQ